MAQSPKVQKEKKKVITLWVVHTNQPALPEFSCPNDILCGSLLWALLTPDFVLGSLLALGVTMGY